VSRLHGDKRVQFKARMHGLLTADERGFLYELKQGLRFVILNEVKNLSDHRTNRYYEERSFAMLRMTD
jgi:hypothetical protein